MTSSFSFYLIHIVLHCHLLQGYIYPACRSDSMELIRTGRTPTALMILTCFLSFPMMFYCLNFTFIFLFSSGSNSVIGTWRSFNEIYQTNKDTYTNPVSLSGVGYNAFEKEKIVYFNTNNKSLKSVKTNFSSTFTWPFKKE